MLKKCYTILKPLYGAKEKAVSGLCLHCVHRSLWRAGHCWSFGRGLTLNRPPVHLTTHKRNRHTGSLCELHCQSHMYITFFLCRNVKTCFTFFSSHRQWRSKTKRVTQTCLSVTVQLFIVQSNQHLPSSSHLICRSASAFTCLWAMICSYLPMNTSLPHYSL